MVEVCGPLSARPPTPPRTTSRPLSEKAQITDSPVVAQTPRDSPFAANLPSGAPSTRQSKRVNFSPWTKYIKPPSFTDPTATADPELKALPPSNECKPTKSILKATSSPAPVNSPSAAEHTPDSFVMLLESVTQQLAGDSLSGRLDAYMQIFGALRTYENLPTGKDMVNKLGPITQFIQRDVSKGSDSGEPLQNSVVIQALKLANTLLWTSEVAPHLPDDFKVFLVDNAISGLQDPAVTKSVVVHYLSILSAQNVHAKIMVNARLTRLLPALVDITDRVGGNGIIGQRLNLYSRVLSHSKSVFLPFAPRWMEHLITGCLHHLKDIRLKAISLGFQLSNTFGPNTTLSKSIHDLFNRNIDKGRKLAAEICERMLRMMADPDSGVHVPQIWSIILLLLRNKRVSIDRWEHFRDFVLVLQKCFNCSDISVKAQAIIAWNRFVFVTNPGETTNLAVLKMLGKPLMSQFERKKNDKQGTQPGALVMFSYHNLLYYAFPPASTYQHLDLVWEEYIVQPSALPNPAPNLSNRLAHALSNMLWSPQAKIWTANRANETHKLSAEELPTLDSKWIRSRITRVLKVFEALLRTSVWANEIEKSKIAVAWVSLARALSNASSKEINPSPDSMQAVAHVLGLLQRIWRAGPAAINAAQNNSMDKFYVRFRFLSTTMILALGNIQFTEKLFLKTAEETFQAANTPTHRHAKANSNVESPILHLLRLISTVPGALEPTPAYLDLVNDTLQAACKGRNSRGSRLELLRQCAELYSDAASDASSPYNFAGIVWKSTAQLAADTLCTYPIESARARDGSASRDYERSISILSTGLKFSEATQEWSKLVDSLVRVVRTEKSDGEIAKTVVEPLAENMMVLRVQDIYLPLSSLLNLSLSITYSHHDMDNGERMDSATIIRPVNDKSAPPRKLLVLMNRILCESYEQFNPAENTRIADYIESLTSFLGSGVQAFRSATLESLQQSLALWIKDESRKVNLESGVESRILTACRALSSAVVNILQVSSPHNLDLLSRQEDIICAGIESSHMSVAKKFVDYWSSTFALQEPIACPERVSRALEGFESRIALQKLQQDQAKKDPLEISKSTESRAEMGEKSRVAFILDNSLDADGPEAVNSSPITKESAPLPVSLEQLNSSQTDSPAVDDTPEQVSNGGALASLPTVVGEPKQRSDVFSMIDSLRSSSPARTPREFGFMTPPHLRYLRNPDRESGTPQTPTLPPVAIDNEDGFLGSSPTPSTRGRTPAARTGIPHSWTNSADGPVDPPSSPPEVESQSRTFDSAPAVLDGSTQNKESRNKKSKRSSASKKKKHRKSQSPEKDDGKTQSDASRAGTPLISRLRSSGCKPPAADFAPDAQAEAPSDGSPMKDSTPKNSTPSSSKKSKSSKSSKKNKKTFDLVESPEKPSFQVQSTIADSFSDEETQLASQLEQDLESAVDSTAKSESQQTQETQRQPPVTRKRKREVDEFTTPTNKERRRSTRFSNNDGNNTEIPAATDPEATRSTRSKRSKKEAPAAEQAVMSSPVESVPKKRRRHSKSDINDVEEPTSAVVEQHADSLTAEPVSKRRRQSKGDIDVVEEPESANAVQPVVSSPAESVSKRLRQSKRVSNHVEQLKPTPAEEVPGETQEHSEPQDSTPSQKQKLSQTTVEQPAGETQKSPQPSETSSSQKRRSSRLSGSTALAVAEEIPPPTKPSSSRSRKQTAKLQEIPDVVELDSTVSDADNAMDKPKPTEDSPPGDKEASIETNQTDQAPATQNPVEQAFEKQLDTQMSEQPPQSEPTQTDTQMTDVVESVPNTPVTVSTSEKQAPEQAEDQQQQSKSRSSQKKRAKERRSSRAGLVTNATTATPEPKLTGELGMISSLKKALEDAKSAVLDRDALKEVDDLLFDIRLRAHEALTKNRR